ncbi:MAG: cryptochrome/photolyase family protein [Chitinophagaceae bacterium]|nr:MAG: cryptochrome/photolyase family protein [Chitinophagaceae bacterium]
MSAITLIFPHQLFKEHPAVKPGQTCYLVEEWLFFSQYHFHKQKLVLHRASMKAYAAFLRKREIEVEYIEATNPLADIRKLLTHLASIDISSIHFADPVDDWLTKRINKACSILSLEPSVYVTPYFLNTLGDTNEFFKNKTSYFQTAFYIDQRKRRNILLTGINDPVGGKWSYDEENRLKFPKTQAAPSINFPPPNEYTLEALTYISNNFSNNYGDLSPFQYPIDFAAAEKWLTDFITARFQQFGIYEDAIVAKEHYLHHSVLSPLLNIGLLTPAQVLKQVLDSAEKYKIPLNSLEGFVRQIIGWREFIRIVYEREGSRQRTKNFWGFTRKIPECFWTGTTGIEPIDTTIEKVRSTGYCHHIERLMLLGNFMLLCEFDPDEVYRWFMEMFVDSYDWVMVPNVYGMTQFADGGLMTTKPYISSSNYVLKMSDYKKGEWCEVWDGLFWRFMHVNRDFFSGNPRLGMLLKTLDKMSDQKRNAHLAIADKFLTGLSI